MSDSVDGGSSHSWKEARHFLPTDGWTVEECSGCSCTKWCFKTKLFKTVYKDSRGNVIFLRSCDEEKVWSVLNE